MLLVAFVPGGSWGVPGIDPDEVQRRFATAWTLLSSGSEPAMDHNGKNPARQLPVSTGIVERGDLGQTHLQRGVARQFVDNGEYDRHVVHRQ